MLSEEEFNKLPQNEKELLCNELMKKRSKIDELVREKRKEKKKMDTKILEERKKLVERQKQIDDNREKITKDIEEIRKNWNDELGKTDSIKLNHKILTKEFINRTIVKLNKKITEIHEKYDQKTKETEEKLAKERKQMNLKESEEIEELLKKYQIELLFTHDQ